jgi:hypothetical protein
LPQAAPKVPARLHAAAGSAPAPETTAPASSENFPVSALAEAFTTAKFHLNTIGKHRWILPSLLAVGVSSLLFRKPQKPTEALILLT